MFWCLSIIDLISNIQGKSFSEKNVYVLMNFLTF